jgi:peptidyl-prolyl cis-trans isomerase A (cyclophilin A)
MAVSLTGAAAEQANNPIVMMKTNHGDVTIELLADAAPKTVETFLGLATGSREWTDPRTNTTSTKPFYDGLGFHRVIKDFMIQGGDPLGTGSGGPGFRFADEIDGRALGLNELQALDLQRGQLHPYFEVSWPQFQQRVLMRGINPTMPDRQARYDDALKQWDGASLLKAYEALGYQYTPGLPSQPVKRGTLAMANSGPNTNGSQFFISVRDNDYLNGKHTVFGRVIDGMDVVDAISGLPTKEGAVPQKPVIIESIRLHDGAGEK